jgi:hypothetical protein
MSRPLGAVCAGALLLAAAGCSSLALLSAPRPAGKKQVIACSMDQVSAHLQATLGRAGITVKATPEGQGMRLDGETKSGQKFVLRLKRQPTNQGERTRIALDWETEADEQFWLMVLEMLAPLAPPGSIFTPGTSGGGAPAGPAAVAQ